MLRAKLIIAVAAAVLFAQIQCVAACASDFCSTDFGKTESVPPCHQHHEHSHHQAPASCSFHLIVSSATSLHVPQLEAPVSSVLGLAPIISAALPADAQLHLLDLSNFSPPGIASLSSGVLRI